jgi:nucleotide-binding universal stress UspA family protein
VTQLATQFDITASEVDLIEGSSPRAIVDLAVQQHAGLIVVGAAQRRGAASAAIGSAAELVAGDAGCDVLIVPPAYGWQVAATPRSQVG